MRQDQPVDDTDQEAPWATFPPVSTEAWRRRIIEDLKGADYAQRLVWQTPEGFAVQPFYRREDLPDRPAPIPFAERAGSDWLVRQDIAADSIDAARRRAQEALAGGAGGLGLIVYGKQGIPVRRQADFERLLDGIALDATSLHLAAGPAARIVLAMLLNEAERRDVAPKRLHGSVAWDPLARLARHGLGAVESALDDAARLVEAVEASGAALHAVCIDAQPYQEAGASAVQELAFALAAANTYLAGLTARHVSVDQVTRRMRFVVPVGGSFFMEMAKLRALRLLAAQLVRAYDQEAPQATYVEAVTARWNLTGYDPHGNLLRATTEATAAVLGGCDALLVLPFDEAAGPPGDFSLRLARNVQLILKHEAHLDAVADPGAGSYYVEALTDHLARHAWSLFQRVEAEGGLVQALQRGFVQQEIQAVRAQREQAVATGRRVLVGVNRYPNPDETRLKKVEEAAAAASPDASHVRSIASSMHALRRRLGEGAMLDDLLESTDAADLVVVEPLPTRRGAVPFEALRLRTERHARETGRRAVVLPVMLGDPVLSNLRATFARNAFGCAGLVVLEERRFETAEAAACAATESAADIVVLCSADPEYAAYAPALCEALKTADRHPLVVVAGQPSVLSEDGHAAGVDAFIHRKSNLLETLTGLQERLGMTFG